jgi:hypothetical protein
MNRPVTLLMVPLLVLMILLGLTTRSEASFLLVAPVAGAGTGQPGRLGPVLRFGYDGTGPLSSFSEIPETLVNDPIGVAFNANGELFVGNRHGNVVGTPGSVSRFTFDSLGNFTPSGTITGNGLEAVHGLAFSPSGELFAANFFDRTISRFRFDAGGTAIPNGIINLGSGQALVGLAFSPSGELFAAQYNGIRRFVFDGAGSAIPNGSFTIPGSARLHFLNFSSSGELFVPSVDNNLVYRLLFDSSGNPVANGTIGVTNPIGVAFAPSTGELLVGSHNPQGGATGPGGLSRFLFDSSGSAVPNGFIPTNNLGQLALSPIQVSGAVPEPSTLALFGLGVVGLLVWRRRHSATKRSSGNG